jgi:hypothetical protein
MEKRPSILFYIIGRNMEICKKHKHAFANNKTNIFNKIRSTKSEKDLCMKSGANLKGKLGGANFEWRGRRMD